MSIGTLLAYTIVSASVIILRYKRETPECKNKEGDDVSIESTSTISDNLNFSTAGKLKPEFWWLSHIINGCGHSEAISGAVLLFTTCSAVLCMQIHFLGTTITNGEWWSILFLIFLILCGLGCLLVIGAHTQNPSADNFRVPWVPVIPGLSILCNVGLMVHLNVLTWIRFAVWMTLGLLVYFLYGIKHSKENDAANSYSMLITSQEANKGFWGATHDRDDVPKVSEDSIEPSDN